MMDGDTTPSRTGSPLAIVATLSIAALISYAVVVAHRCFWSDLAKIPGPRLAAATGWYETSYDYFQNGMWTAQLRRLHDRYGPIVRINPREVHVSDPDFTSTLYMARHSKDPQWLLSLGQEHLSAASTPDHELHRIRRGAMDPFFTRTGVSKRIDIIESAVEKMVQRLEGAKRQQQVICVNDVYTALTLDVIALFCYGKGYGYLDRDEYGKEWRLMMRGVLQTPALYRASPMIGKFLQSLPEAMVKTLVPALRELLYTQEDCRQQIRAVMQSQPHKSYRQGLGETEEPSNVFEQLLASETLSPQDKTIDRLMPEGLALIVAGSDTTAKVLAVTTFYLSKNPPVAERLRGEIDAATRLNGSADNLSWTQLEQLPWLSAVIKEGTRMAGSISSRSPRVLSRDVHYGGYDLPAGTVVSQTMYLLLNEPSKFPEPHRFRPERWLIEGPNGKLEIDKRMNEHMVAWSKGPRTCLGMWLAYAEMYLVVARLFSRFSFELVGTDESDVVMFRDHFLPYPADRSEGVRVRVTDPKAASV